MVYLHLHPFVLPERHSQEASVPSRVKKKCVTGIRGRATSARAEIDNTLPNKPFESATHSDVPPLDDHALPTSTTVWIHF